MLEALKQEVCQANLSLVKNRLVILTWGNVSAISNDRRYVVVKPSGVEYETMTAEQMVVVDMDGNIVEGELKEHCAYALKICNRSCSGGTRFRLPWYDPSGLFLWKCSLHEAVAGG